jgi:hypothetical protein
LPSRSTTSSSSACSSSIVDGKSVVSRLTIRGEERLSCTDTSHSFLSNNCPGEPLLSHDFALS